MDSSIKEILSLAKEYHQTGDLKQAEIIYRKILKVQPNNIYVLSNLANLFHSTGKLDEAIVCYQKSIELDPKFAGFYNNMGNILRRKEQYDEAIKYYQKAIELAPNSAGLYYNLGQTFRDRELPEEAINAYQKTLQLDPDNTNAYYNLGNIFRNQENPEKAITCYQKALQINPEFADAYINLGSTLQDIGLIAESIVCFKKALAINPVCANAYNNLGDALNENGKSDEAELYFRRAIEIEENNFGYYQNLIFTMNYNPHNDAQTIFSEHLQFANRFEKPLLSNIIKHTNDRKPQRRLRIGYVSPDFKRHSVAYFIEPVLSAHNREQFEVFCYSLISTEDEVTKRLRGYADHWRNLSGISDEKAADLIRNDSIDILIDLAGHTRNNRILLFALKPAPVQVNWIGYPATTGFSTMDYKIVDNYTDPPGMTEQFYSEKLIRMPESFLCYCPDSESPNVSNLPAFSSGYITFGSFNTFAKMSRGVISLWSKILVTLRNARLVIKSFSFASKGTREQVIDMFKQEGIASNRIELLSWDPLHGKHIEKYNQIDIALDTFPYNGTTTTCEALWMGVPVIVLSGNTHASRVGVSLLSNIGLTELVAETPEEYISIAVNLANDIERVQSLRKYLRDRMLHSSLIDARRFTVNLESAFRTIWKNWCRV
jgi:protein O-GlcNAc transferase